MICNVFSEIIFCAMILLCFGGLLLVAAHVGDGLPTEGMVY